METGSEASTSSSQSQSLYLLARYVVIISTYYYLEERCLVVYVSLSVCMYVCSCRDSQPMDILGSNHVLETDKLQNEISSLKKQLAQRDQALLEKDKQVCKRSHSQTSR